MGRRQCENCGAPYEVSPEATAEAPQRCGYCNAAVGAKRPTLFGLRRAGAGPAGSKPAVLVIAAVAIVLVIGIAALVLLRSSPDREPPTAPSPSAAAPAAPPVALPPPTEAPRPAELPPPAPPPRERTVHDDIRDFFEKVDGRLCVAGNLSRFGPFAGSVDLTVSPDGSVSRLRVTIQPEAPKVTRCLQQAFSRGPVYRGRPVGVVYHFGGGRSPDGLQFRAGIELKGSAI